MILSPLQQRVAGVVADIARRHDFALGGGVALQALGIIERPTEDFDSYSQSMDPDTYAKVEQDLVEAASRIGLRTEVIKSMDWFRCVLVSDPGSGDSVKVDLGMLRRTQPTTTHPLLGPILAIEDQRMAKVDALVTRAAARDYLDVDAIITTGNWTRRDVDEYVAKYHPAVDRGEWARTLEAVSALPHADFEEYGISVEQLHEMAGRFTTWSCQISRCWDLQPGQADTRIEEPWRHGAELTKGIGL